jgi:hypothetical protein
VIGDVSFAPSAPGPACADSTPLLVPVPYDRFSRCDSILSRTEDI